MSTSTVISVTEDGKSSEANISNRRSETIRFCSLATIVFVCYLLYGYFLELIFTLPQMENYGWFLTLIQFFNYSIFAFLQLTISGKGMDNKIPLQKYLLIGLLTVGTMGFSNTSIGYLNYPTQVIFKSCKLIPVMIGSVVLLKKRYTLLEVISCCLMCVGLIWFTLADNTVQPDFNAKGIFLVSVSLLFDAIIGNVQEGAMRLHREMPTTVVLYSYAIGFAIILSAELWSSNFLPGIKFSIEHPVEIWARAFLLSLTGFCGVQAILKMISDYGAVVTVTVTTFRKALSICLSFIIFQKPFTIHYFFGGLLVMAGIYLNVCSKENSSREWLQWICLHLKRVLFQRQFKHHKQIIV